MASLLLMAVAVPAVALNSVTPRSYPTAADPLASCPGYAASNVKTTATGLTADLTLAGEACNAYGTDLKDLVLSVQYDTDSRLHVKIQDPANNVYQVPESVLPRPNATGVAADRSALKFDYVKHPFSFSVSRTDTKEVLFDTSAASLVFESQYVRLRTKLPDDPYLYGLGEHSDPFRLNTTDYIRTMWNQDAYSVPTGTNLYGMHPVYYELRETGAHGVFFLNSNGMDIIINKTEEDGQFLEYNTLGGVLDFYFVAGPDMVEVAKQYSEVVGLPAMIPYWGLGFHQCRYGYQDAFEVAEVVYNYSTAGIPLETMWTDIDYMYLRRTWSLDPERFNIKMMRGLVDYLHDHDQHYIMMVDPNVAYQDFPGSLARGIEDNVFLLRPDPVGNQSKIWEGVVWPGIVAFPDWFAANITDFWVNEFKIFFDKDTGVDIDALWIDLNEPSDFPCYFPCSDPQAAAVGYPPAPPAVRSPPRPLPGFPCDFQPEGCNGTETRSVEVISAGRSFTPSTNHLQISHRTAADEGQALGLPGRDLLYPQYAIHNKAAYLDSWNAAEGGLSNKTVNTDVIHQNGLAMYDTHNLFGTMMSAMSRTAMMARRPLLKPLIITRSTFAGAGAHVAHWLGDNLSDWEHYRLAMRSMMAFNSIYQVPMVGTDTCGFGQNTTEQLCARWAALSAFAPFYRDHNEIDWIPQELYRWPATTESGKKNIGTRYQLLDYFYTAMYQQTIDGTPAINPMMWLYPHDKNTWTLELQYFYGPGILVAPVTEENKTSVDVYMPNDRFYDWYTHKTVEGAGKHITITDQGWADIPLFMRGGIVYPVREGGSNTTAVVRTKPFDIIVAIGRDGKASGDLYLDDGISLEQPKTSNIKFEYENGVLVVKGTFGYTQDVKVAKVVFLGLPASHTGHNARDGESGAVSVTVNKVLTEGFTLNVNETQSS